MSVRSPTPFVRRRPPLPGLAFLVRNRRPTAVLGRSPEGGLSHANEWAALHGSAWGSTKGTAQGPAGLSGRDGQTLGPSHRRRRQRADGPVPRPPRPSPPAPNSSPCSTQTPGSWVSPHHRPSSSLELERDPLATKSPRPPSPRKQPRAALPKLGSDPTPIRARPHPAPAARGRCSPSDAQLGLQVRSPSLLPTCSQPRAPPRSHCQRAEG